MSQEYIENIVKDNVVCCQDKIVILHHRHWTKVNDNWNWRERCGNTRRERVLAQLFWIPQTFTDVNFHYWMKTIEARKGIIYFLSWNELWKYFVPFQCFVNSFLKNITVLISLPVYIMNDSWPELVRVTAVKFQLSFCSQGCCSINSRVYWRHCQLKCHRRLSV